MRYFIIKREDAYKPQIVLPYSIEERINIACGNVDRIEKSTVWKTKENSFTFYSDILTEPALLLSDRAKDILRVYDAKTEFKQIILFSQEQETVMQYYLPLLCEISGIHRDKKQIKINQKDAAMFRKTPIVKVKIRKNQYFLANMEIIESFLKRRLSGINITAVDVVWDEEVL